MSILIRQGTINDIYQINNILNHYIINTSIIFDLQPWDIEKRKEWLSQYNIGLYHLFVAIDQDKVIGLAYNSKFMDRSAYNISSETSVYLRSESGNQHKGIATLLYTALFNALDQKKLHRLYARIALPNEKSINFHKKLGFNKVGSLDEVGHKFGRYHSVDIYQKKLN